MPIHGHAAKYFANTSTTDLVIHCTSIICNNDLKWVELHQWCNCWHACLKCGRSGWVKPKTVKFVFVCFSAKHAALRSKNKNWLAWNQDNVSELNNMSTCKLLFQ